MNSRLDLPPKVLWPLLLLAASAWSFVKIAGEMLEGDTHAIDMMVLQWCRVPGQASLPIGPQWFQEGVRDLTALGSPAVLTLAVGAAWGYLMLAGRKPLAWLTAVATGGGLLTAMLLKNLFSRSRPDALYHATVANGYSFPSGHAMMSAVVFLTLAALLARVAPRVRLRWYIMGIALVLTGLTGLSRVYLGVHWVSDVAAGWAAGAAWAMGCWLIAHRLHIGQEFRS